MKKKVEELSEKLLRPKRQNYSVSDLGPTILINKLGKVQRHDLEIQGSKGNLLVCSLFVPEASEMKSTCVIYLHSMAGSRLEALPAMRKITEIGYSFFAFDFPACGHSEGDIITFGIGECEEVRMVIQYLKTTCIAKEIVLWGRSMGAVTSLLYASKYNGIKAIVADSAFSSMNKLVLEVSSKYSVLPEFILKMARSFIRSALKDQVGLDFDLLNISDQVSNCKCPVLLIASKEDLLISFEHSRELFKKLSGNKRILYIKGGHNEIRPSSFFEKVTLYVQKMVEFGTPKLDENDEPEEDMTLKEKPPLSNFQNVTKSYENFKPSDYLIQTEKNCLGESQFGEQSFISMASFSFAKNESKSVVAGKIFSKRYQNHDRKDTNNSENEYFDINREYKTLDQNVDCKENWRRRTMSFAQKPNSNTFVDRIKRMARK